MIDSHNYYEIYITCPRKQSHILSDQLYTWTEVAFERSDYFECFIFRKHKYDVTIKDGELLKSYGSLPDDWNYPDYKDGYSPLSDGCTDAITQPEGITSTFSPADSMAIKIWHWQDAPEKYKALSTHGGDEDYVAFVPHEMDNGTIPIFDGDDYNASSWFGPSDILNYPVDGGRVYIGAHS